MTQFQPNGPNFGRNFVTQSHETWERSRLEWRLDEGGEPALLAARFLADFGLELPGPERSKRANTKSNRDVSDICGASIFISAAAGASMIGAATGAPTPVPAVPDLVVVIYARGPARPVDEGRVDEWSLGEWVPSWSVSDHAHAVERVRDAIGRGDVYQVNVVGHASAPYQGDPMPALRRVTRLPGAAHGGLMSGPGWALASASPELLVRVAGGVIESRPIKGTRPATATGRRELLNSAKERAEHVMIVDLERNDLARIARIGTVDVPELFAVRRWCDLWQAESRVLATLADGVDLAGVLRAVCPGGSVTGAPKHAALQEIAALEPVGRGASMGALGWLDADGLELGLTIRTVAVDDQRVHVWAGGGITWDSDPAAEVAEAAAKAAPVRAALQGAQTG
jgi:para-aminobenzoate synthetase component 1